MLDVALGLEINLGRDTAMARQDETLLDILIRAFSDQLTNEVRRRTGRVNIFGARRTCRPCVAGSMLRASSRRWRFGRTGSPASSTSCRRIQRCSR